MSKKINLTEEQFKRFGINISYDNPLTIDMNLLNEGKLREGLIMTYPAGKVCGYISNYLGIPDESIIRTVQNGVEKIVISIPSEDSILEAETMKVMTNLCGYFLSLKQTRDDGKEIRLHFEPKFQDDVTKMVNKQKFLVHVSPHFNNEKIMKFGFLPKTKNTIFNYPDRVYFFLGTCGLSNIFDVVSKINSGKDNPFIEDTYDFYLINVNKIPENIKFQVDPNTKDCVFTTDIVPNSCIMRTIRKKLF